MQINWSEQNIREIVQDELAKFSFDDAHKSALIQRINDQEQTISNLRGDCKTFTQKIEIMTEENNKLDEENGKLQLELDRQIENNKARQTQIDNQHRQAEEIKRSRAEVINDRDFMMERVRDLEARVERYKAAEESHRTEILKLQAALIEARSVNDVLIAERDHYRKMLEQSEVKVADLDAENAHLSERVNFLVINMTKIETIARIKAPE